MKVIYLNINTSRTEDLSDPEATFDFWDDFDDLDISDYTQVSGSWETTEEPTGSGNGILKGTASGTNLIVHNTADIGTQKVIRAKVRPDTGGSSPGVVFGYQDSSNFYHVRINASSDELQIYEWVGGSTNKIESAAVTINENTWYVLEAIWKDVNTIEAKLYDENGNLLATATATTTGGFSSGKIGFRTYNAASFDNFVVRKYTEPEPSVTVLLISTTPTLAFKRRVADCLAGAKNYILDQMPELDLYSGGSIVKTLTAQGAYVFVDTLNSRVCVQYLFVDDSNDAYTTDEQKMMFKSAEGNYYAFEAAEVFEKAADEPLPLRWDIYLPYDVAVCSYVVTLNTCLEGMG